MSQDDLPPPKDGSEERTLGEALGEVFGAGVWIVLLFAIVGGLVYAFTRWMS